MKTCIKKLPAFLAFGLLFISINENCIAQESSNTSWKKIIKVHFGYTPGSSNWEYSHPLYSGSGGVQNILETGSFKSKSIVDGQFELSKGYLGFSAGVGIFPAEIKVDKNADPFNLNSLFLEIEGLFYPIKNPTAKVVPLIKLGGGGLLSFGDLDNMAQFVSFGGGLQTFFAKSFGASLMVKGRRFTYNEIPLDENISGDIVFTNFSIQLGAMYAF